MASREYFIKQARALLSLAKAVNNPALAAELVTKAADLEEKSIAARQEPLLVTPAIKDQPTE